MPTFSVRYRWPNDDEQLAGQAVDSHFDEDGGWWAGIQQNGAVVALATALTLVAASTTLATSVFSQLQDDPAGSLVVQPLVYEEYWQNSVVPVNWAQPSLFVNDDTHVQFAQSFTPDDGDWRGLVSPVQATSYVQLPLGLDEQTPQFAAVNVITDDNESIWAPQIQPWEPTWTLLFFLDDGSVVPVFQYDEDFWSSYVVPQNWPQPQQPFSTSDEDNLVIQFVTEDVVWQQFVAPVASTLIWPQQWLFEQNDSGNLVSFANEDYWQNPTPPVPDSIRLLRQDAFEQTDATGTLFLDLDEGLWVNPTSPVPDSLLPLQQWPFEQNEPAGSLYAVHDEDFWQNPVPPVVLPQPSLAFSDDDVVATFVQNFTQDEDFWQQPVIAPVVANNIYNQPFNLLGNQEDDVPVLSPPPPPPPPPFCPLPPTGPDADIKMSTFGGSQPTQALFCRICKSGNPLIVRADYAIWCQDCCAFVSKQDTYMGTTQAPGQFKNVF